MFVIVSVHLARKDFQFFQQHQTWSQYIKGDSCNKIFFFPVPLFVMFHHRKIQHIVAAIRRLICKWWIRKGAYRYI